MIQLPFPSAIEAQPCSVTFLTIKTMVRKIQKNDGQTGSCAWTRGGGGANPSKPPTLFGLYMLLFGAPLLLSVLPKIDPSWQLEIKSLMTCQLQHNPNCHLILYVSVPCIHGLL